MRNITNLAVHFKHNKAISQDAAKTRKSLIDWVTLFVRINYKTSVLNPVLFVKITTPSNAQHKTLRPNPAHIALREALSYAQR